MKDMALWNEGDWIAAIASVILAAFLIVGAYAVTRPQEEVGGHPKGLYILFFAEMWERFSYYGMRALLIFYLTQHWLFNDSASNIVYGAYVSLVYITPVLGGWLADRYLGQRKAVLFGAVLLTFGHFFMAFEGEPAAGTENNPIIFVFWLALALIIVGSGFLKANISVIVGQLYPRTDTRRDAAYTIFYMGINLGAAIGSLLCGYIGETYGWAYGFGLAGIGMLAGLVVFLWGQKFLDGKAEPPNPETLKKSFLGPITVETACYLAGVVVIAVAMLLVMNAEVIPDWFVGSLGIVIFLGLVTYAFVQLQGSERKRMFAAIYFVLAQIPFWALFEQAGSSLTLFTDRLVDKQILGVNVPTPVFQFLNAGYIVVFAPIFAWMWIALAKRKLEPSTPVKFAIGVFLAGLGFLSLVGGIGMSGAGMTAVGFIFLIYWVHTMGELMVSPVGLSAVTKLAPARVVGMTMGAWFLYSGLSNYLAGVIARTTGAETIGGQITDVAAAKATYVSVYSNVGYVAMGIGVLMLIVSPIIKSWMKGNELPAESSMVSDEMF